MYRNVDRFWKELGNYIWYLILHSLNRVLSFPALDTCPLRAGHCHETLPIVQSGSLLDLFLTTHLLLLPIGQIGRKSPAFRHKCYPRALIWLGDHTCKLPYIRNRMDELNINTFFPFSSPQTQRSPSQLAQTILLRLQTWARRMM
jgi:hypothetical protein